MEAREYFKILQKQSLQHKEIKGRKQKADFIKSIGFHWHEYKNIKKTPIKKGKQYRYERLHTTPR